MKTSAACQKHQWMCSTVETVSASSIMSPSVCAEWESTRNHKAEITLNRELCGSNLLWVTEQDDSSPSVIVNHSPSALQGCCSLCVCVCVGEESVMNLWGDVESPHRPPTSTPLCLYAASEQIDDSLWSLETAVLCLSSQRFSFVYLE